MPKIETLIVTEIQKQTSLNSEKACRVDESDDRNAKTIFLVDTRTKISERRRYFLVN